jgi:cytoplasmic iron level regulating protein YaaA (DUF328/UPF0246 family)
MLAIISPSKTQDFSECNIEKFSQTRQQESSNELVSILKNQSQSQISKLMSISEKLSALNFERFQKFKIPLLLRMQNRPSLLLREMFIMVLMLRHYQQRI